LASQLKLTSLDTVFKLRATCNSMLGDFYISNNQTWNRLSAKDPFSSNEPLEITEVGLYNEMNELVAVSKFSQPINKTFLELLTFELDINL